MTRQDYHAALEQIMQPLRDAYVAKLMTGTDPGSENYWGEITDYDQYIVEAAALALTLLLHKEYVWEQLPERNQQALKSGCHTH